MSCYPFSCIAGQSHCCIRSPPGQDANLTDIYLLAASSLDDLRPGSNPFIYLKSLLLQSRFPLANLATYIILLSFSALHLIIILTCLTILLLPYIRHQPHQRAKVSWLIRKVPIHHECRPGGFPTPLLLLNSGVIMTVFQLMESLLSQVYIYLALFSIRSQEFASKISLRACYTAVTLFQFHACWTMAWTSICTKLYSQKSYPAKIQHWPFKIFQPLTVNIFFCTIPALVTIMAIAWIFVLVEALADERDVFNSLSDALDIGSLFWSDLTSPASESISSESRTQLFEGLARGYTTSLDRGVLLSRQFWTLSHRERAVSWSWVIVLTFTLLVYMFGTFQLLCLIKSELTSARQKVHIGVVPSRPQSGSTQRTLPGGRSQSESDQPALKKGFRYLAMHSCVVILAVLYTIAVRIILAVKSPELSWNTRWSSVGSWLILVSGALTAMATTFQCWRIYVDFDIIIPFDVPCPYRPDEEETRALSFMPINQENCKEPYTAEVREHSIR